MVIPTQRRMVHYDAVRPILQNGMLVLYRPHGLGLAGHIIALGSGYSHAAMFAWWGQAAMLIEMLQFTGGRAITLSSQVDSYPGRWDVFDISEKFDREGSVEYMKRYAGFPYGWGDITYAAIRHMPYLRKLIKDQNLDSHRSPYPPDCSHACAEAIRIGGGIDLVRNRNDRLTEPGDLAKSPLTRYLFTLVNK